jgi:hypothetical protein
MCAYKQMLLGKSKPPAYLVHSRNPPVCGICPRAVENHVKKQLPQSACRWVGPTRSVTPPRLALLSPCRASPLTPQRPSPRENPPVHGKAQRSEDTNL